MANELKVKNGLIVYSSGSANALDVQGSQGQLFSVTDTLSGSLFSVNDISGIPIVEVLSDNIVKLGTFNDEAIIVTGSRVGMGISAPAAKLHISGSSSATLFEIDSPTSQNIIFANGTGNVGIGTGTPAVKLSVNGHVTATSYTASMTEGLFFPNMLYRLYKPGSYLGAEYTMDWSMWDGHVFTKNSNNAIGKTSGNIRSLSSQTSLNLSSAGSTNYYPFFVSYTIANTSNQTGTASGIFLRATETDLRGMLHNLVDVGVGSRSSFFVRNTGDAFLSSSLGIGKTSAIYNLDVSGSGNFTNGLTVTGSVVISGSSGLTIFGPTTFSGSLNISGSIQATSVTASYIGNISAQSTINNNPVIDMYTAIAFSVAL